LVIGDIRAQAVVARVVQRPSTAKVIQTITALQNPVTSLPMNPQLTKTALDAQIEQYQWAVQQWELQVTGPIWRGGRRREPELLAACYQQCLEMTLEIPCASIAFPPISIDHESYPLDLVAKESLTVIKEFLMVHHAPDKVVLALPDRSVYAAYCFALEQLIAES
jgi:hypothetical protein